MVMGWMPSDASDDDDDGDDDVDGRRKGERGHGGRGPACQKPGWAHDLWTWYQVGGGGDDDSDCDRDGDDEDDPILAESWKGDWHRLCNNPTFYSQIITT